MSARSGRPLLHSLAAVAAAVLLGACATVQPARVRDAAADLQALGLGDTIAPWEDGLRTGGARGTYEWWYFDAHLEDGSTLVVVFYTKPMFDPGGPLRPVVQLELSRPDGTKTSQLMEVPVDSFRAEQTRCELVAGPHRASGDLRRYALHLGFDRVQGDLTLTSEAPAWRPSSGVIGFGARDEKYFAWLPSVPHGRVEGTLTVDGKPVAVRGTGYHDHNWGNAPLPELLHDWYWGRARVGDYAVIASFLTAERAYGGRTFPLLYVAQGDRLLASGSSGVQFTASDVEVNPVTKKPVASTLRYEVRDGAKRFVVTFVRRRDLVQAPLVDGLTGLQRFLATLAGFDGAYHRFTGSVTVEAYDGDGLTDRKTEDAAVWELMYLGRAPR